MRRKKDTIIIEVTPYFLRKIRNQNGDFYELKGVEYEEKTKEKKKSRNSFEDGEAGEGEEESDVEQEVLHSFGELMGDDDYERRSRKKRPGVDEKRQKQKKYNTEHMIKIIGGDILQFIASPLVRYTLELKPIEGRHKGIIVYLLN